MNNFGRSPLKHAPHIRFGDAIWSSFSHGSSGIVQLYDTITGEHKFFVNAIWSSFSHGSSGIVQLYDTITGEHKFFWGSVDGIDQWEYIVYLSNYGHKLPVMMVRNWLNASGNLFDEDYFND